jgi:hypothetical protein
LRGVQGKLRGLAFQYLHFLLGCALNAAGAGVLMALQSYGGKEEKCGGTLGSKDGVYEPHVSAGWVDPQGERGRPVAGPRQGCGGRRCRCTPGKKAAAL